MKWIVSIVLLAAVAGGIWWLGLDDTSEEGVEGPGVAQATGTPTETTELQGLKPGQGPQGTRTDVGTPGS